MAYAGGIGVSVTYKLITWPGRRKRGPPYSHAQLPGGSCSWEKKERQLSIDCEGVVAGGSSGRPCDDYCRSNKALPEGKPHGRKTKVILVSYTLRPLLDLADVC